MAKNCDFNRFFSVFYKFLRENTKFDKKSLCFQVFFACFLFKRRISPVSSHFQQIIWAIFSGYTPWLAEHAMHALLPNHDNAEFCRQTNNCQNGLFLAALF
ncbi:MAG: hypothetical protein IT525_07060 [Nitrosomonas sp.]|nr:hypothetical protein [Nitrosomonas sp.]